jgi:hypothetical protein
LALLRYVVAQRPQVGNDLAAAAQAGIVLLVEDEEAPSGVEQELLLQNVAVLRPQADWNEFFARFGA